MVFKFCIDPVYVCAISLMCRLYQPLCISLLQKNNSIFDRLFTNTLLHKNCSPFSFEFFFSSLLHICLLSHKFNLIKLYSQALEANADILCHCDEARVRCRLSATVGCRQTPLKSVHHEKKCSQGWSQNNKALRAHWTPCTCHEVKHLVDYALLSTAARQTVERSPICRSDCTFGDIRWQHLHFTLEESTSMPELGLWKDFDAMWTSNWHKKWGKFNNYPWIETGSIGVLKS